MPSFDTPKWVKDAVFYQIFPERFANGDPGNDPDGVQPWGTRPGLYNFMGGDLQGIIDHLPYLQDLGITALYLNPIFWAGSNHKYDAWDYLKIDPAFGDADLFKTLVEEAHQRGIRIMLDAVFNHCGDGFWAFKDVMEKGQASSYADWFCQLHGSIDQKPPNYQTCGGADYLPKLNTANPVVLEYLMDVAVYWLREFKIDGWRLDVPWKIPQDFWQEFRRRVKAVNPEAYIVAEIWRDPLHWLQGDTCDAVMNYPQRDYILDFCSRDTMDAEDFDHFTRRLLQDYGDIKIDQLNLLGSHDTPRLLNLCGGNKDRMVLAVIAMFSLVGVPMVYYGDEIGMDGNNDPDCRKCMNWDSALWDQRIYNIYRTMIQARHAHPALRSGNLESLLVFNGVYAYRRFDGDDEVVVILNPRYEQHNLIVPVENCHANHWKDLFSGQAFELEAGCLKIDSLPAQSAFVLVAKSG
jgi:glycosidase